MSEVVEVEAVFTAMSEGTEASAGRRQKRKSSHVSIPLVAITEVLPITAVRPSPENERLYRPVLPTDPEVVALADSIRRHGVKEPLVITADNYVLSGHRRYVAAQLAGLACVPCRREKICRSDPAYLGLLREYNRQRVKSADEVVREELLSADPEEAYRLLTEHRRHRAQVDADAIVIEGEKRRAKISKAKLPLLNAIVKILNERRAFWPLTDRQIHYALLNDPPLIHASKPASTYQNNVASYKATCELVTRARLEGVIPFEAIDDPTRPVTIWDCHGSIAPFVRRELDGFLKGYYRDLLQSQPNHIEVVAEKNTIDNIIRPVTMECCLPLTTGRGYCSLPPRRKMCQRFRGSGKEQLVLLVLSDFDPEGEDIAHSFARSMRDDFGVRDILPVKVALTAQQVQRLGLPPVMKAKETSSRYKKFSERHGDDVYELEAIAPEALQAILREAIDGVLDTAAFNAEVEAEKQDAAYLDALRRRTMASMDSTIREGKG